MRIGWTGIVTLAATLVVAGLLTPMRVDGHETLVSSDPEADAVLEAAPRAVTLTFSGELTPDVSGFDVLDAAGETVGTGAVDLEVAERNVLRGDVTIVRPGRYEIVWRITGLDGHAIEGRLAFTVGDAPDTAVSAPGAVAPIGVAVLLLAVAVGIGRPFARTPR